MSGMIPWKHSKVVFLVVGIIVGFLVLIFVVVLIAPSIFSKPALVIPEEKFVTFPGIEGKEPETLKLQPVLYEYIEVVDSCDAYFEGECLNVRSGPGVDFPKVTRLRNDVVLKVDGIVERNEKEWYKIVFDEPIRYKERVKGDWYVSADYVRLLRAEGTSELGADTASTTKRILVDRSEQMLYAYDGDDLYMETSISTGLELTPTPRGEFTVYRKTLSRYMQGPLPGISEKYWDLPGVPWNLYFSKEGAVIHGAYWHDKFGQQWSSGCVNMSPEEARVLYEWADLGTKVLVRD